ncbi:hypothetical protein [Planomonospora sp. ID82291]|uniref:hypothetical protein n=1 Tax=Planomonospora sp. ID82291 TaxID=2738136 RepID=UPI0018C436F7|nr:hypothetical protein [Planomonospora sp. ID82291]MBG0818974.1 hypothetical protein [Planomonospora sp. ID82291]
MTVQTVHGYIDGVAYAVTVGEARPEAADTVGVVSGSPRAVSLLRIRNGDPIGLPHGRYARLDVNVPGSVVEALTAWTEVVPPPGEDG